MMEVLAPVFALIGMFGMIVWIVRMTQSGEPKLSSAMSATCINSQPDTT